MKLKAFLLESMKKFELTELEDADEDVLAHALSERGLKLTFLGKSMKTLIRPSLPKHSIFLFYDPALKSLHHLCTVSGACRVITYSEEAPLGRELPLPGRSKELVDRWHAGKLINLSGFKEVETWLHCTNDESRLEKHPNYERKD